MAAPVSLRVDQGEVVDGRLAWMGGRERPSIARRQPGLAAGSREGRAQEPDRSVATPLLQAHSRTGGSVAAMPRATSRPPVSFKLASRRFPSQKFAPLTFASCRIRVAQNSRLAKSASCKISPRVRAVVPASPGGAVWFSTRPRRREAISSSGWPEVVAGVSRTCSRCPFRPKPAPSRSLPLRSPGAKPSAEAAG